MTITTNDCKNAILKFFSDHPSYPSKATKLSDIKRISKYKDSTGLWVRKFSHLGYEDYENLHMYVIEQLDGSLKAQSYPDNWTWYYFFEEREEDEICVFLFPKYPGYEPFDQHVSDMLINVLSDEFDEVQEMYFDYWGEKTQQEVKEYLESKGFIYQSEEDYLADIYGKR
jgi:hypothetical protein